MKRFFVLLIVSAVLLSAVCYAVPETEAVETESTETEVTETDAEETSQPEYTAFASLRGRVFVEEDNFTVSLYMTADSLRGGTVKIAFDDSQMKVLSVAADNDGLKVYHSVKQGAVNIVFYTDSPYDGTLKTADITFKIVSGEQYDIMTVWIEDATVSDGKTETAARPGDYSFELACDINTKQTETDVQTDTDSDTETVTDTETDKGTDTTAKEPVDAEETEPSTDTHTGTESTTQGSGTTANRPDTDPTADSSGTATADTGTETDPTDTTDDKGSDTLTSDDGTAPADETKTNDTAADREPGDTYVDITSDNVTADVGNQKREPLSMTVIISLIGVTAAGAAVGAVFLIRHAVKAKKQNSDQ